MVRAVHYLNQFFAGLGGALVAPIRGLVPGMDVDIIVEGYADSGSALPLVVVGMAPYGDTYMAQVREAAGSSDTRFLGGVWDQDLLNQLAIDGNTGLGMQREQGSA